MADVLIDREFLRMIERSTIVLEWPVAASFTVLSTSSFPFTLLWIDIHFIPSLCPIALAACQRLLIRYYLLLIHVM